jgi:ribosomal protein S18 acetylase RimI-like enzyme
VEINYNMIKPTADIDLALVRTRLVEERDYDFVLNGRLDIFLMEDDRGFWDSEVEREATLKSLREDIDQKQVMIAFVIDKTTGEEENVGFIGMVLSTKVPFGVNYGDMDAPLCWVSSSWVVPKFRGSGIGRLLYSAVETYAQLNSISEIWCDVYNCNQSSRAFHERLGFLPHITIYRKVLPNASTKCQEV